VDLRDYFRVVRKRWTLIVLSVLVALGAALSMAFLQQPTYQATSQMYISVNATTTDQTSQLLDGSLAAANRVKSYADIVNSPRITAAVQKELGSSLTADQIGKEISADNPLDTVLLNVHVRDVNPVRAQEIANAVAQQFGLLVNQLETPQGSGTSPVKVSVVQEAQLPIAPVAPNKKVDVGLGLLLGIALGVALAVLLDVLDTSVKSAEELEAATESAVLGVIGFDSDATKSPLIVQTDPHSPRAEAFRQLRTNLQFVDIDHPVRSIVITSSIPQEGKSTTTANLAITLAQAGLKVVLVEADLRRPKLMQYLGVEGAVGVTSVLIGRVALDDALQPWGNGSLMVLPSGPTPPNPSELLGSQGMADLISSLEQRADIVLVDAPPLLPVTDAAVLAKICDGALLIVRHGQTSREQVIRAVESLRVVDAHLIGNVLNMAPAKGPDAYGYGYAYRYTSTPGNKITPRSNSTVPRRPAAASSSPSSDVIPTGGGRRRKPAAVTGVPTVPPPLATVTPLQPQPVPAVPDSHEQSALDSFFTGQPTGTGNGPT
jgi:capsular exopolysaccharide synthesis family protein